MAVINPVVLPDHIQLLFCKIISEISSLPAGPKERVEATLQEIMSCYAALLPYEKKQTNSPQTNELLFSLAACETKYRELTESISEPFVVYDASLRLIYRNRASAEATMIPNEKAIGLTFPEIYPELAGSETHQMYLRALETRQPQKQRAYWSRSSDGKEFYYDLAVYPTANGLISFSRDVSEQVRIEKAQQEASEKAAWMARFPDENPNPVARVSLGGTILYSNRVAASRVGWKFKVGNRISEPFLSLLGEANRLERLIAQDAQVGDVFYTIQLMPFPLEGYVNIYGFDITERRRAEDALMQSERLTRAINGIGGIIHSTFNTREIMNRSIEAAAKALGCDSARLSLRIDHRWRVSSIFNMPEDLLGQEMDDTQELHALQAIQTKMPVAVHDALNDARFNSEHLRRWGIRSVLVVPIIVKDEALGVMFLNYQNSAFVFKQVHIDFATQIAASLSSALENSRLYQELEKEISERRLVEAALRESETRERERANELEAIMDAAPAVIWISRDPDCREMVGNRYSYDFLHIRHGENVSKTAADREIGIQEYHMEIDHRPVPVSELPMQIAAATGKPALDYAFDLVYRDRSVFNLFGNVNPLFNQEGKPNGAIGVFVDLTRLRQLENEQMMARAEIEVQRRLMDQREQERQVIARDLHDGPIQTLSSCTFQLQMIKEAFPDLALQVELNQIGFEVKNTIHELREVLNDLRPPALMHFGFSRVIEMYTSDLCERFPEIEIDLQLAENDRDLSDQARLALFRIYQAGINNIVRHSGATRAWVEFRIDHETFHLEIRDNGKGFCLTGDLTQLTRDGHFGMVGMKERAEAIGGVFSVKSEPGAGTQIVVEGPFSGKNRK